MNNLKHVKLFENFDQAGKWFVAQDGDERFKFQAKDMDEAADIASKTWNAKVLGEASEDMEFEDTPMDEAGNADLVRRKNKLEADLRHLIKIGRGKSEEAASIEDELGSIDAEIDDSKVNEGSYTDFLTSHGNDLKKAVTQIKEIGAIYDDRIEDKSAEIEKAMSVYDEEVGNQIDRWTGDSNVSTDKIAKFAIENQDKTGTEPRMVLDAIADFYDIMKN